MSSQHSYANVNNDGLPIIYWDFEPTTSHIDAILWQLKEFAEEKNKQYSDRIFVYITTFNGNKIDSSMTVDEVYQKLYGCTKAEKDW